MTIDRVQTLGSLETVPGTAEALVAADALAFSELQFEEAGTGLIPCEAIKRHFDTEPPSGPANLTWRVTGRIEVKAGTAADSPPEIGGILQAAGFDETIVASTSVTYDLSQDPNVPAALGGDLNSWTQNLEENEAGDTYIASGLRWQVRFTGNNAGKLHLEVEGVGRYADPTDSTPTASAVYNAGEPFYDLQGTGNPMQWAAYDLIAQSFELDVGLEVVTRENMASPTADFGNQWPALLRRANPVSGSLVFEGERQSVFALWNKYRTQPSSQTGVIIYEAGSRLLTMNFRAVSLGKPAPAYPGAKKVWTVPFTAHHDGTNGAMNLVFT